MQMGEGMICTRWLKALYDLGKKKSAQEQRGGGGVCVWGVVVEGKTKTWDRQTKPTPISIFNESLSFSPPLVEGKIDEKGMWPARFRER